jgi:two-component system nitrogen regulation response regulator NtrX
MATGKKRSVLVTDDDGAFVDMIGPVLTTSGFGVVGAPSGENALSGIRHTDYDLIIIDIFMKGMGGIEGIQRIRELRPDAKIIATSAGFDEMPPDTALEAATKIGADAILSKPFKFEDLESIAAALLSPPCGPARP